MKPRESSLRLEIMKNIRLNRIRVEKLFCKILLLDHQNVGQLYQIFNFLKLIMTQLKRHCNHEIQQFHIISQIDQFPALQDNEKPFLSGEERVEAKIICLKISVKKQKN